MSDEEFDEIFNSGGLQGVKFEEKHPDSGGVLMFSRVGFNAQEDLALVSMGFRCGDLCGSGGLYLVAKEEGSWKVQRALSVWMS